MEVAGLPVSEGSLPLSVAEFYRRFSGVRMRGLAFSYGDEGAVSAEGGRSGCEEASEGKAASLTCSDAFVSKGPFVVVEGPSGSGKSTLFKLALGAYDAEGFAYELGSSASSAAPQVPPGVFAYVPQDNFLFAGTIRENVAFAAPDVNDGQVRRACEVACAWDFVEGLPLGLDTVIGEHGQGLSQGQLQRLAIARAVCSGVPVMALDEVTSALDGKTEAAVLANIAALPEKTVFVAAHRAKAREFATMRLRVDGGVVSAEGLAYAQPIRNRASA